MLSAQPMLLRDINPGPASSFPQAFIEVDGDLFFVATHVATGTELWKTDGTMAGTALIRDLSPGVSSSDLRNFAVVDNTLYFSLDRGANLGEEVWRTNGSATNTVRLLDLVDPAQPGPVLSAFAAHGHFLTFVSTEADGQTYLWNCDGHANLAAMLEPVAVMPDLTRMVEPAEIDGITYFAYDDGIYGPELWRSDGTPEGTFMVMDIRPGAKGAQPTHLTVLNGKLYFSADDGLYGRELWGFDPSQSAALGLQGPYTWPGLTQ